MANFHQGERLMQAHFGMAESMAKVGEVAIRSFMPEQHRDFFSLLPYLLVGSVDDHLQPTASILMAAPGFVSTPSPELLQVQAMPHQQDLLYENLQLNRPLGLLGLQAHTKRRNRMNGIITEKTESGFSVAVQQSFGNCAKYITPRYLQYELNSTKKSVTTQDFLSDAHRQIIRTADTFFIASVHLQALSAREPNQGVDISHRGGAVGFVDIVEQQLKIPDYRGNFFFNSFGNIQLNPKASLLFLDFRNKHILQLWVQARVQASTDADKAQGVFQWLYCDISRVNYVENGLNLVELS